MYKKSTDVLMVFPSGGDLFFINFNYHLGSSYIIAYLREHGFHAEQFISKETYNVKECVRKILKFNPKIVGFTVYEKNYMQCILISKGLKNHNPDIIVIFGGPTPTVQSDEILECTDCVDLCVRQEGEETVLELLTVLSKENFRLDLVDLERINGLVFKNENSIVTNPDRNELFSNRHKKNYLDKYPSPYLTNVIPPSEAVPTGIITARGCNQNCTYCNCAVLSRRNISFHSIERVIEELIIINEHKKQPGNVHIYDDAFTILPSRAIKICEAIIENNIKLPLLCATRCDKVNEELLGLMKQAGFQAIGFSLESAVPRVLRTIGKVSPPSSTETYEKEMNFIQKFKDMTSYAKKIGIKTVFVSIMIGLPGETFKDAQKTIDFINKLEIDEYTHNILHIFKGTPIYQNHQRFGYNVKPIGQKNRIVLTNNFPFDVRKIRFGNKCSKFKYSSVIDYDTLKLLSFNLKRRTPKPYFNNLILNSDILRPSHVRWLQENLAINGAIIHIYSNENEYLRLYEKNFETLYGNLSPTMYYESYYWEKDDNATVLKSGRMSFQGEDAGLIIRFKKTQSALEEYEKYHENKFNVICQDHALGDTIAINNLFEKISKRRNYFKYLYKRPPLPQFQTLCRWMTDHANCQKMETAIIGDDNSIKICWYSEPIGNVKSSFIDLLQNLKQVKDEMISHRNCNQCKEKDTCIKCPFLYPLSSQEYCFHKTFHYTNEPARIIDAFNVVKDLLYRPMSPLDFR